jgi:hypothetical protein
MKTLLLTALFSAALASAQPPPGTISRAPSSDTNSPNQAAPGEITITNRSGQIYSAAQIQSQFGDLHRAVEEMAPTLAAITETYSNSVANAHPSAKGGIAGVLGAILNRNNTNNTGSSGQTSGGKTNSLGSILEGVLGINGTNAVNAQTLRDLASLQEHLQTIEPILQRLDTSTNTTLAPTGRTRQQ